MKRLAVLGYPVAHSLSPRMHAAAFRALGIDSEWSYEALELRPDELAAALAGLPARGFVGANVTVPHKRAALELADRPSAAARAIGAANLLSFSAAGTAADNTDAPGLIASLPEGFDPRGAEALVLGAGGAARAVVWALHGAGARVSIHNRTAARARGLAAELGGRPLELGPGERTLPLAGVDLLVNATSIGLASSAAGAAEPGADLKAMRLDADEISDRLVVVDLVYGTTTTELCATGSRAGATVIDGLEILVHQGAESLRIWTGLEPPIEAMRQAVRAEQQ